MVEFFSRDRIIDYGAPIVTGSRIGYMEMLPGGRVCAWVVVDYPAGTDSLPGECECVAKVITPMAPMLFGRGIVNAWLTSKGFHVPILVSKAMWVSAPQLVM